MGLKEEFKRSPAPVYLVCGGDRFLKEEFFREVKSLPERMPDFNYDVFRCGVHPAEEIISRLLSYPVGDDLRVVVAEDAGKLPAREQEQILGYLANPCETSLFFMEVESLPAGAFFKKVLARGRKIVLAEKNDREVSAWLNERAGRLGKKLSREALEGLKELGGRDLHLLANELEKLALQVGEDGQINAEALKFSSGWNRARTGFELGRAISSGDSGSALRILYDVFIIGNAPPEMLLGSLAWQFRTLWKVSSALGRGIRGGKLASVCGIPPFRVREFTALASKYSDAKLEEIFRELLRTDLRMKTRDNQQMDMEVMVINLCRIAAS